MILALLVFGVIVIALISLTRCAKTDAPRESASATSPRSDTPDKPGSQQPDSPPDVVDTPANPQTSSGTTADDDADTTPASGGSSKPKPPAGPTPAQIAYQRYLAETKRIVTTTAPDLRGVVSATLSSIASEDRSRLSLAFAPDEGASPDDSESLVEGYPEILDSVLLDTVNVYSVGSATIYFGFADVEWEDGGVLSRHTISVPLRFIDGEWYLSTMDLETPGLTFVQSIHI